MNYSAFEENNPCDFINIKIPQENDRKLEHQALSCFGRLAVISSENISHNQYHDEIKVLPITTTSLMILKLVDYKNKDYVLLDLYKPYKWQTGQKMNDKYFKMKTPKSITDKNLINKALLPRCSDLFQLRYVFIFSNDVDNNSFLREFCKYIKLHEYWRVLEPV